MDFFFFFVKLLMEIGKVIEVKKVVRIFIKTHFQSMLSHTIETLNEKKSKI